MEGSRGEVFKMNSRNEILFILLGFKFDEDGFCLIFANELHDVVLYDLKF